MKYQQRKSWLLNEISRLTTVDILDADFVDRYVAATRCPVTITLWGANRCRQLSSDLQKMSSEGLLDKYRIGLGANWQPGFPRWVNCYSISSARNTALSDHPQPSD